MQAPPASTTCLHTVKRLSVAGRTAATAARLEFSSLSTSMSISMICTHCEKKQLFPSAAGGDATDQTKLNVGPWRTGTPTDFVRHRGRPGCPAAPMCCTNHAKTGSTGSCQRAAPRAAMTVVLAKRSDKPRARPRGRPHPTDNGDGADAGRSSMAPRQVPVPLRAARQGTQHSGTKLLSQPRDLIESRFMLRCQPLSISDTAPATNSKE